MFSCLCYYACGSTWVNWTVMWAELMMMSLMPVPNFCQLWDSGSTGCKNTLWPIPLCVTCIGLSQSIHTHSQRGSTKFHRRSLMIKYTLTLNVGAPFHRRSLMIKHSSQMVRSYNCLCRSHSSHNARYKFRGWPKQIPPAPLGEQFVNCLHRNRKLKRNTESASPSQARHTRKQTKKYPAEAKESFSLCSTVAWCPVL